MACAIRAGSGRAWVIAATMRPALAVGITPSAPCTSASAASKDSSDAISASTENHGSAADPPNRTPVRGWSKNGDGHEDFQMSKKTVSFSPCRWISK